jgi:cytochrome c oxidase assembly factor CtaG
VIAAWFTLVAIVAYESCAAGYRRRFPYRTFSYWHDLWFSLGTIAMAFALSPWIDRLADASFAAHMAQHVALTLIGPPLVLLGAPLLLAAGVARPATARAFGRVLHRPAVRVAISPAVALLVFVAVLWGAHFSPLYEAALENEWIHVLEHVAFVTSAFLFWVWVLPSGSLPRPVPYAARLLLLFLAIPQGAFLAIALQSARGVLYPHYLAAQSVAQALADQRNAGAVMWLGGGTLLFVAFIAVAAEWAARERGAACA